MPTAIDAFCGAGGLTLGLQHSGFSVLTGFDLDPICIRTMQNNPRHIKHPVYQADVRNMLGGVLLAKAGIKRGQLDLLAGGPPCQGFSVQRTTGTDEDARNLLVHDYGDLITEVLPKFFLIENVPGIGGARGRDVLATFESRMRNVGYVIHQAVLDAQDFGVPQRRRRYLIVGDLVAADAITYFKWPKANRGARRTVRDAISDLPSPPSDGSELPGYANHRADRLSPLNRRRIAALQPGEGRVDLPDELLADCHKISADVVGHRNVYGRMAWDDVAPTITARFDSFTRGKFGHPVEIRTISLREGARLQTFPDDYVFTGSKVEVARQIGNAVPLLLAKQLGRSVVAALNARKAAHT